MKKAILLSLFAALFCTVSVFAQDDAQDGSNGPVWVPMYEGVDIATYESDDPLMKVIAARIDLKAPGIEFKATEPNPDFEKDSRETVRRTTAEFLEDRGLSVAINGNFYSPFNKDTIGTEGDSDIIGLGVSDGFVESEPVKDFPSFVVKKDGDVEIAQFHEGDDLSDIQQAVSGNKIVLKDGEALEFDDVQRHPRTGVGYSQDKRYVYFITIDGRQQGFSMGASFQQVGEELKYVGAYQGLNLDGGGSTTFVVRNDEGKAVVLNRPCNMTEDKLRHNGNGIGVKANGDPKAVPEGFRF